MGDGQSGVRDRILNGELSSTDNAEFAQDSAPVAHAPGQSHRPRAVAPADRRGRGGGAGSRRAGAAVRARRHDPDRKDRIVDTAIEVIAEHGVAGTTHRMIAAAADVPLGSLTYHFSSLEDLRAQAFQRHAERMSVVYAAHFDGVETHAQFVEAVTDLVHGVVGAGADDWAIAYELYLAALRDPALRVVTETWMRASRAVLERFVDPVTARGVDALIEGLVMHKTLSTSPLPREQIRWIVARAVGSPGNQEEPRDLPG